MKSIAAIALFAFLASSCLAQSPPQTMDVCLPKIKAMYQGNCISDYAVVPVTAVELAWCLKSANFEDVRLSAQDLICNCEECQIVRGNGCMGGSVSMALNAIQ